MVDFNNNKNNEEDGDVIDETVCRHRIILDVMSDYAIESDDIDRSELLGLLRDRVHRPTNIADVEFEGPAGFGAIIKIDTDNSLITLNEIEDIRREAITSLRDPTKGDVEWKIKRGGIKALKIPVVR